MNQKKILALGAALTGALSFYACSSSSSSSGPESNYDYEFSSWEQALTTACTAGQTALLKGGNEDGSYHDCPASKRRLFQIRYG